MTEDFAAFFQTAEFAQTGELRTSNNVLVRPVVVILTTPSQDVTLFDGQVTAELASAYLPTTSMDDITTQHKLITGGETYRIAQIHHDGTGVTLVQLRS